VAFISVREQFDTGTPMGRAMMFIISVFSQLERETIAERIRDNMHELAKTGRWLGGVTPLGYCSRSITQIALDGKKHSACHLELLSEEEGERESRSARGVPAFFVEGEDVTCSFRSRRRSRPNTRLRFAGRIRPAHVSGGRNGP